MNRIERLTAILLLLHEKPRTSEEIARHFEVSKRTVLRDVQALSEMGVPVIAREGAGGGYSLPEDYALAPLPLTAHEAFLLLLALRAQARLADTPFAGARASLADKLRALLPETQLAQAEQMLAAVQVDEPASRPPAPFLEALLAAAQQQRWVQVTYQSAERLSEQRLLPRQISMQHGLWYCRAYSYEHGEERTYRVDRLRALAPAKPGFQPPALAETRPYDHPEHPEVVVTLSARGAAAVESEPQIGPYVQREPDGGGRLAFRCPPAELDWFARYFAGLGPEAEVLAPPALRERLQALGAQLAARYAKR